MQHELKPRFTLCDYLRALVSVGVVVFLGGLRRNLRQELTSIERTDVDLAVAGLPAEWDGVRIVAPTDLHAEAGRDVAYLRSVVQAVNDADADIIAMVGDTINCADRIPASLAGHLRAMRARMAKLAVLGNHDYYGGGPGRVADILAEGGFELLVNAHCVLRRGGQPLCMGGLDDATRGRPDLDAVFAGADEGMARLLLCHNPDVAEWLTPDHRVAAILCGHSHGGQINLPLLGRPLLPLFHAKYAEGLAAGPMCPVYVSRGLGTAGLPVRYRCRPELPVFTLRRQQAS